MTEFLMTIKGNEAGSRRLAEVLQGTLCGYVHCHILI